MIRAFALLAFFNWLLAAPAQGQQSQTAAGFSVERIIELHVNYVPCLPLVSQIRANGVSFEATDDVIRKLKAARNPDKQPICEPALEEIRSASALFVRERKIKDEREEFAAKMRKAEEAKKINTHVTNGEFHFDQGDYAAAILEFAEALKIDPNHKHAQTRAETARNAQKVENALRPGPLGLAEIERLLAGSVTTKRVAGLVNQRKISFDRLPEEGEQKLRSAGATDEIIAAIRVQLPVVIVSPGSKPPPGEAVVLVNRGKTILRQSKDHEAVRKLAEDALKLAPNYKDAWELKGDALRGLKKFMEAIESYDRALAIDKVDAFIWIKKALAHQSLSQHDVAVQSLDDALKLSPMNVLAWIFKGDSLVVLKRCSEARVSYDRVLELDPQYQVRNETRYTEYCGS